MPHRVLFILIAIGLVAPLPAQQTPRETLSSLFDAMRRADTTGLATLFHPAADLHSVSTDASGTTVVQAGDLNKWMAGIAGARAGTLDEQLHYTSIRTDGRLATAWTPYTFVLDGQISHCGTNAFQFVQDGPDGNWRILNIVDTRRREECERVDTVATVARIEALATAWHAAAAAADSAAFFGAMAEEGIYIGTDPGEHWTKAEFLSFAAPYFAAGKAWSFVATERHVYYDENENIAYWDELLDTWMGPCRGTAVVKRNAANIWEIVHYTLSVAVPNDAIQTYIDLVDDGR
ncbi:SnoaL-like protein [Neolewinella xylanilytica]|uniref:SnoaL-like protein n=1 Tax=Neolewinella xylanilytica TaxID=1514080 RepID=A0A2S6I1Z4_9BACT|nr:nuclear transport factor 2 family protein [Neolewinella xylanilytica]PPK85196.1 SnoaL-like protein [Neolewinella xylanilytica]